jgi:pyruvate/2-oxoglutarate/acetoin dehydrogenase E1 component
MLTERGDTMREITLIQAIREAFVQEMTRDDRVFIMGESVRGGVYPHTEGLVEEFGPDRVIDTPIAEAGIVGAGVGAAMAGYRPVVDLMYADFMYIAGDETFLKAPMWHFTHGGKVNVPVVIMGAAGGGLMLGNEHSRTPTGMALHHPGLKVVVPSTPYDAKGLMATAIRDNNPVVYLWHKNQFMKRGHVPEEEYTIPFGQAEVRRSGSDVTVVATSKVLDYAMEAAESVEAGGISVEVIDPRTLEPFDLDTVLESVEKTMRLVIVDEDTERCGFAAELSAQVMEKGFDFLDAPVQRVCAANYPIAGGYVEQYLLPNPAKIQAAIERAMA